MNNITTATEPVVLNYTDMRKALEADFMQYVDASETTTKEYAKSLDIFLLWLGAKSITKPTRQDIITFRKELREGSATLDLIAEGKDRMTTGTRRKNTVAAYMCAVRQFFKWTEAVGLYPNVAENVKTTEDKAFRQAIRHTTLSELAVDELLMSIAQSNNPTKQRNHAIVALAYDAGLRTAEIAKAQVRDLVPNNDTDNPDYVEKLYVRGKKRHILDAEEADGDAVPIPKAISMIIHAYLDTREDLQPTSPLFCSDSNRVNNEPMIATSISRIIKTAMKKAGFENNAAHDLRRSMITTLLKKGTNERVVQQHARHKKLQTTLGYAYDLQAETNESARILSAGITRGISAIATA